MVLMPQNRLVKSLYTALFILMLSVGVVGVGTHYEVDVGEFVEVMPNPNPNPQPEKEATRVALPTPDSHESAHRVLIVGDGTDFEYSHSLHALHPNWVIVGTRYGDGNNIQTFVGSNGNLSLYTNVDATKLGEQVTGNSQYDGIIFNNPHAGNGSRTADLITQFMWSARERLTENGEIHINVTKSVLTRYPQVASVLGLTDTRSSTINALSTFGQTIYYAPYVPNYTTGESFPYYANHGPASVGILKNFRFHKGD